MGKRGPRPEPRTIAIAKGSWRAKARPGEPSEVQGAMTKPDGLGPIASDVWDRSVLVLRGRGCESPAYEFFLERFAQAHQDLADAVAVIESDGAYVQSEKGGIYQHPAVGVKHKAIETIAKFGREFGLSPTSIRDIQAGKPADAHGDKRKKFFGA